MAPLTKTLRTTGSWVTGVLVSVILPTLAAVAAPGHPAPARLAVVVAESAAEPAGDMLTVELSKRASLQLLERGEIEKVWREQALSAGNRDYLKLGQVLGADGLLLLETITEGTNQYLGTRLVAVKPGVVLTSERFPWPMKELTEWSGGLANHLQPLLPKLTVLAKDAVPVSVLNLRSAVQTAASRTLEQELTLLLIHRLAREREVFVLERQHLGEVLFEKDLKPDDAPFWTGRYLLDGVLDKDGFDPDRITLNARLVSPQGGPPAVIELAGARTNLAEIVELLTGRILSALHRSPGGGEWRPLEEAQQYYDEARWALRWNLKPVAQAACESAWALGLQTSDVARLRIHSYTNGIPVRTAENQDQGEKYRPPGLAAAGLAPVTRALELFCEGQPRFAAPDSSPDLEWLNTGLVVLNHASGLLSYYHRLVDARAGVETELARLRSQARRAAILMEPDFSAISRGFQSKPRNELAHDWRALCAVNSSGLIFVGHELIWNWGGLWFEKPEAALDWFRRVLDQGWAPEAMPRFTAWSWNDRRRIPALEKQFVRELMNSTDADIRLEGRYLSAVLDLPAPAGTLEARVREWADDLWSQRERFYQAEMRGGVLRRMREALEDKYEIRNGEPLDQEPHAGFLLRLRHDYLQQAPVFTNEVFAELFPHSNQGIYARDSSQELLPLFAQFRDRLQLTPWQATLVQNKTDEIRAARNRPVYHPPTLAKVAETNSPIDRTGLAPEAPHLLTFNRIDPFGTRGKDNDYAYLKAALVRSGRLWLSVSRMDFDKANRAGPKDAFVSVDPQTGRQEVLFVPEREGHLNRSFEVTADSLYATATNRLLRYRFGERRWEMQEIPVENPARMVQIASRLYLTTRDSILQFHPEQRTTQVLASARRRPAINALDALGDYLQSPDIFSLADNRIGVVVSNHVFTAGTEAAEWREIGLPRFVGFWTLRALSGSDPILMDVTGGRTRARLLKLKSDGRGFDPLLEHRFPADIPDPRADRVLGAPRWLWPKDVGLHGSFALADGEALWVLAPHQWWEKSRGQRGHEAALLRFEPEYREPLPLWLQFSIDGRPYDIAGLVPGMQGRLYISFLKTPAGLVLADEGRIGTGSAGYWLIPQSVLTNRLAALRPAAQAKAETERLRHTALLARFDTDRNGRLDPEELTVKNLDRECLESDRARIDQNGNGRLDIDELPYFDVNNNGRIEKPEREAIRLLHSILARVTLAAYDTNRDGGLDREEWQQYLTTSGSYIVRNTRPAAGNRAALDLSLESLDHDKDGRLDEREVMAFLERCFAAIDLEAFDYQLADDAQPFSDDDPGAGESPLPDAKAGEAPRKGKP